MWIDIENYEGLYQINEYGQVKSLKRVVKCGYGKTRIINERLLQENIGTNGYAYVNLCKNGKIKTCYIHRLMGKTFLPNPNNYPEIDHINSNKLDNRLSNLRWLDRFTNASIGSKGKKKNNSLGNNPKAKQVICTTTGEVFGCIKEFSDKYGINYSTIRKQIRQGTKIFKGYAIEINKKVEKR